MSTAEDEALANAALLLALATMRARCDRLKADRDALAQALADHVSGPSLAEWVAAGMVRGYVVGDGMVCSTHDGIPYTEDEAEAIAAEDGDPDVVCAWVIRVAP
jgi:hypothetical protein